MIEGLQVGQIWRSSGNAYRLIEIIDDEYIHYYFYWTLEGVKKREASSLSKSLKTNNYIKDKFYRLIYSPPIFNGFDSIEI